MPHLEGLGPKSGSLLQEMGQSQVWLLEDFQTQSFSPASTRNSSNQILGLLPTIATGSIPGSSLGPFSTTTDPGFGSSASPSPLACPIRNNTIYINDFGTEYNALCGRYLIGDAAISSHTDTFEKCLDFCDIFGGCAGATYFSSDSSSQANCLPYNTFTGYREGPALLLSGVSIKGPAINEFANRVLCPALDNQTISDPFNNSYLIGCDKTLSGNSDIAPTVLSSLAACLLYCSLDDGCSAVVFTGYPPPATGAGVSYNCFPRTSTVSGLRKRQNEAISSDPGSQFATRVSLDQDGGGVTTSSSVPGGVASIQATGQAPSGIGGGASAAGTGGSLPGSGNSTQTEGLLSPTGTGTSGPGAGNSTQTGGPGGASSTGTTIPSVNGGFGNTTGTSTGVGRPTPSNTLSCSGSNNIQYTDEFDTSYNITCDLDITGSNAVALHVDTFNKCISFCDILSGCAGVTYQTSSTECQPYSSFAGYSPIPGPSSLLAAVPAKGGLVNNTFSYDQLCPGRAGKNVTDRYGVTYTIGCDKVISGTDLPSTILRSLNACLLYCSLLSEGCAAVTFTGYPPGQIPSGTIDTHKRQANPANCFPKSSTGPVEVVVPQDGASFAKRVSPAFPVGSGNPTTGPGALSTSGISGNSTSGASTISTSNIAGSPTSSASGISTIAAGVSSTSGIAAISTSAVISGSSSTSGAQPPVSSTSGRLPFNPSSSRAPLGNSTLAVTPAGSATSVSYL